MVGAEIREAQCGWQVQAGTCPFHLGATLQTLRTSSEQGHGKETLADLGVCLKPSAYKLDVRPLLRIMLFQFFSPFTGLVDMISSPIPNPQVSAAANLKSIYSGSLNSTLAQHIEKLYPAGPLVIPITKLYPTHNANEFRSFARVLIGVANAFINIIMTPPAPRLLQMSSWVSRKVLDRRLLLECMESWDRGWKVIMKHLFPKSIPGDLLARAHLSNRFDMRDKAPKLKVGDTVNRKAKIARMTNGKTGKTVSVKGTILLEKTPVMDVISSFFYRIQFEDFHATFMSEDDPEYKVPTNSTTDIFILKWKE
ncbi:fatty acid synthase subunit beta [Puccinia sorghi]|uniref:Fatty acid synthase subunit beta n=1 Tax=Puccinia sorghi TaxID=27349 RepID=A0A0L6VIU7_9BASI|nr:fatty acid synthase subunit beta [Puccinia sorghi]